MATAYNVLILNVDNVPDSWGEVFDPAGIELPDVEVPVLYGGFPAPGNIRGYAKLRRGLDGHVYADIDFRGPETQVDRLANLYPSICATLFSSKKVFSTTVLDHVRITGIGISASKNADPRIKTLAEQGVLGDPEPSQATRDFLFEQLKG
jgi:hypothetical protein